jgi:hypothetical protein
MVGNGLTFSVTGYFHEGTYGFSRDVTSAVTWLSDTTVLKIINNTVSRVTGAQDTVTVGASVGALLDSITFILEPQLRFLTRIRFQVDTVPFSTGWNADNGAAYTDARGYGWVAAGALSSRDDRKGNPLQKSFVTASPEKEYKIKCLDGDYILKMSMGDNIYGSASSQEWIRFGTDTLIRHSGASNGIKIDTIRVFGNDGIHLFVNGPINYIVAISSEGVDINLVAQDDGSIMVLTLPSGPLVVQEPLLVAPSPCNLSTRISYNLSRTGPVTLMIFNAKGEKVALLARSRQVRGFHTVEFDGAKLPSGVYVCRLAAGQALFSKKIILLK